MCGEDRISEEDIEEYSSEEIKQSNISAFEEEQKQIYEAKLRRFK